MPIIKPMMNWRMTINPLETWNYSAWPAVRFFVIVICLISGALRMRTSPDFGLRIMGSYDRGCLYIWVGRRVMPAIVRSDEVDRILVLQSSTIHFWLREASDLLCARSRLFRSIGIRLEFYSFSYSWFPARVGRQICSPEYKVGSMHTCHLL